MMRKILILLAILLLVGVVSADVNTYNTSMKFLMHLNSSIADNFGGHTVTNAAGYAINTTMPPKFGSGCVITGEQVGINITSTPSDFAFGTNSFTISMWINRSAHENSGAWIVYDSRPSATQGVYPVIYIDTAFKIVYNTNSAIRIQGNYVIPANSWHQIVLQRNATNSTTFLYVDGVQNGSVYSDANTYLNPTNRPLMLTSGNSPGTNGFYGGLDEVAIWNGALVPITDLYPQTSEIWTYSTSGNPIISNYTSSPNVGYLTPMTEIFTDTSTGSPVTWNYSFGDTYFSTSQNPVHVYSVAGTYTTSLNVTNSTGSYNVKSNTSQLQTDDSVYHHSWLQFENASVTDLKGNAWTTAGGAAISNTAKKFGTGSLAIQTNDARATSPSGSQWDRSMSTGELEFWINITSLGDAGKPLIKRSTGGDGVADGWGFMNVNGTVNGYQFWYGNSAGASNHTVPFNIPMNTWTHVVLSRNSSSYWNVYKDGQFLNSLYVDAVITNPAVAFQIGANGGGTEFFFYLDEFRFWVGNEGFGQYRSSFSLPYSQYNGNLYTNYANVNPNATLRYKTNPGIPSPAAIFNQTEGGLRTRTAQIQNITNATYISAAMTYDPLHVRPQSVSLNTTIYGDMTLVSSSIDGNNGIINFNVSRALGIKALFDNRTDLVDVPMLYYNYSADPNDIQFFSNGNLIDGQHNAAYPVFTYIQTNLTYGTWGTPLMSLTSNATNPQPSYGVIQFLGNSTNYPDSYNWSFGDGTYSNLQSPTHYYTTSGLKTVSLQGYLAANGSITNTTTYASFINVSGTVLNTFVVQDIWMAKSYVLTLHVTDSTTGLPIVGTVTALDGTGTTSTTTTGTFYLTLPYGATSITLSSAGYYGKQVSYIIDADRTETVQLVPLGTTPGQNVWWTPHIVQITLFDALTQNRLYEVNVSANYNQSSMPTEWVQQLYGIQSTPAGQMVNKTLALQGETGGDGTITFTMLGSLKYDMYLTSATYGLTGYHVAAYPSDSMLNLYIPTTSTLPVTKNSTYQALNTTRVYYYEPDINNVTMCIDYMDSAGLTTTVTDIWKFTNNNTVINQTVFIPGTTMNTICNTTRNIRGASVMWYFNASRSDL
jgi:PKD repeat protein